MLLDMGPREAVVTKPASGEEVAMALDRDELAARCLVARLTDVEYATEPIDAADAAVAMADALLARLRPEAVAPAPSRPEWVRITGPKDAVKVTVGGIYRVVGWHDEHGGGPIIECDGTKEPWHLYPHDKADSVFPSWEPCAAPSPAATPAAWVPSVGDRVRHFGPDDGRRFVVTTAHPRTEVIRVDDKRSAFCVRGPWIDNAAPVYDGPATSSERAAAGLPVDESAFDEAKEREAAVAAYRAGDDGCVDPEGTKYPSCRDSFRNGWLARARVAAKGGAS